MTSSRIYLRGIFIASSRPLTVVALALFTCQVPIGAQSSPSDANFSSTSTLNGESASAINSEVRVFRTLGSDADSSTSTTDAAPPYGAAPMALGSYTEHANIAAPAEWNQPLFSRIGIGADVSPLGVGIKSAIVLNRYLDARLMGNFFNYTSGRFEVNGFNVKAKLHMASAAASLDWYPFNGVWRLSPGVMFFNGNQISATAEIAAGTSFDMNNQTFYSANANSASGAIPLTAEGDLGLHSNRIAATITGGFGKFVPRSNRHWSFPSEFGVAFTGAPSVNVILSGWACKDRAQTACSNVADPKNPIAIEFNSAFQSTLDKWRRDLKGLTLYPLFSYSVVYSFDIR